MTGKRFQFTYGHVDTFADRLRISAFDCDVTKRFFVGLHASDPADIEPDQAPITIDVPKQDRAAYQRAAAAFNAIMDEHERTIAARNARRRAQAGANQSHPFAAVPAAALLDQ